MTTEEIKELIDIVNASGIAELEVTRGDSRVRIRRSLAAAPTQEIVLPAAPALPASALPASAPQPAPTPLATAQAGGAPAAAPAVDDKVIYAKSPIVGT